MQPSRRLCKKSASSNRWLARQQSDPFVKARTSNSSITSTTHYRSRASHKLLGLVNRYPQLLPRGGTVVDLGCAPGGWAQVAAERVGKRGTVIGVDLLPVRELGEEYPNVNLIQGDFLMSTVHQQLVDLLPERRVSTPERDAEHTTSRKIKVDTVMSDMMANMTGVRIRDVENSLDLCRSALEFAIQFLRTDKPGGNLLYAFQVALGSCGY
jgi:23S rRNA (uridine2552-2'-O)-methyltransferase